MKFSVHFGNGIPWQKNDTDCGFFFFFFFEMVRVFEYQIFKN